MPLSILSNPEKEQFETPPRLVVPLKQHCFDLPASAMKIFSRLRTPATKVGFVLQYGYFVATQRFFPINKFPKETVKHVTKMLGFKLSEANLKNYTGRLPFTHQKTILSLCQCKAFDSPRAKRLVSSCLRQSIAEYAAPKTIFMRLINFLDKKNIEVPMYNILAELITKGYLRYENKIIRDTEKFLIPEIMEQLEALTICEDGTTSVFKQLKYIIAPSY